MSEIRGVLFDADGVIQHATDDLEARLRRVLGFLPDDLDSFLERGHRALGELNALR